MLTELWGFLHKIMIYSGQGHDISDSMIHTEFVVDNLMSGLYHKGRSLYHYIWTIFITVFTFLENY